MQHGHGKTSNSPQERLRRLRQPAVDQAREEQNRQKAQRGGQPNEQGITQGQNAEQGNTINPRDTQESGEIRH